MFVTPLNEKVIAAVKGDQVSDQIAIYELLDPRDRAVRYVGQSNAPAARLRLHCSPHSPKTARFARWLDALHAEGLQPEMVIVGWYPAEAADEAEKAHIRQRLAEGCDLLNVCDGGKGRAVTRTLHAPKDQWLEVGTRLRSTRTEACSLLVEVSRIHGTSKPATKALERALNALESARSTLESEVIRHFPEWADEVSAAFYGTQKDKAA